MPAAASHKRPMSPCVTPATRPAARFVRRYQLEHPLPIGPKWVGRWAFGHPSAVRALQATLATVGVAAYAVGMVGVAPWGWLMSGLGMAAGSLRATRSKTGLGAACLLGGVMPVAVSTALGGPIAGLATGAGSAIGAALLGGHLFEKLLATVGCDTASYPYTDKNYAAGRLYHIDDARQGRLVPVLELDARRPHSAGFAHGYLLGPQIRALFDNISHALLAMPNYATTYPRTLAQLRSVLEANEIQEIQGLVLGFNTWAMEAQVARRITFNEVLGVQLLPDMCHFQWERVEQTGGCRPPKAPTKPPPMGCTSLMLRGADGKVTWGRNMDWGAFGECGSMSLPIVWKNHASGHDYAVLGVPGIIGAVTGWNNRGLSLAMNVVGGNTRRVDGVPAALYNRRVLRDAASVAEVANFVAAPQAPRPLGPYHLMVADATDGRCISFYQNLDKSHHVRALNVDPMWCLNWSYPENRWDVFASSARQAELNGYFGAAKALGPILGTDAAALVEGALQLGSTNNFVTLHTLVFDGDCVSMRWSNAFAAQQTPVEIRRDAVFAALQN